MIGAEGWIKINKIDKEWQSSNEIITLVAQKSAFWIEIYVLGGIAIKQ